PVVIVVDNLGTNQLNTSPPPEFRTVSPNIPAAGAGGTSSTSIFTAAASEGLPELILQSNGNGPISTAISVTLHGHLYHRTVNCDHGASASIDFDASAPISYACDEVDMLCPLSNGQSSGEFEVAGDDLDPQNIRILLIPENEHPKIAA